MMPNAASNHTASRPVKVLVVDDSSVARMLLVRILESDAGITVVGTAEDGAAAVEFVYTHKPDVVLMDIHMPRMDGLEATRIIMETQPLPVIVCSSTVRVEEAATAFKVMEAGAVACVEKPVGRDHPHFARLAANICQTVKLMAEVKVVRRWPRHRRSTPVQVRPTISDIAGNGAGISIVGIGASTGGPPALQEILAALPKPFPVPILVVQHIAAGFVAGLVEWLQQATGQPIHIATYGASPLPGHVYLAPDDLHMGVAANGGIVLTNERPQNHLRPSVSFLFRSLAEHYGSSAIGVLLTGMGKDGAAELKLMKDAGAVTIAQDADTAIVNGMPGAAVQLGAATHVLPLDRIAERIVAILASRKAAAD